MKYNFGNIYKTIFWILILVLLMVPISIFANSNNESFEGQRIYKVKFKGLVQTDELTVKSVISTSPRSNFSQKTIDEDIKKLYDLKLFSNIKVDVEKSDNGLVVTFIFTELPTVRNIIIKGNKKIAKRTILDEILLKKNSVFRVKDVEDDVRKIKKLYEDKGFPKSEITYSIKRISEKDKKTGLVKNMVDVTFLIKESRRMIIKSISFSGVTVFKEDKLRRLMKTKQRGYWFSSGFFSESKLEGDKKKILTLYGEKGYIDAEIIKIDKKIEYNKKKNRDEIYLTIYIREGKQYKYGGVEIYGNKIFTKDELYSLITLKKGDIFNKTKWENSIQAIRNLLAENGYIYYTMDIKENKNPDTQIVSYRIHIVENNKAHIEHIFITGNKKTKDFVIRRELLVHEGEVFNSKKIQESINNLYNLQYFSTVNIDVKPGSEPGLVDLIFNVEEQRTGMFSFGLSYSTSGYGLALFEEVSANNFLGRGIKLHEKVSLGLTNQSVELGVDEPWLFNTPTSVGTTLKYNRTQYDNAYIDNNNDGIPDGVTVTNGIYDYSNAKTMTYTNTSYSIALRGGRRFHRYYGINSELSFSVYRNYSKSNDVPFDQSLRDQYYRGWPWLWKNYLSVTGYRDSRDLSIFATRGTYFAQNISFYGGILGGESNFIKLNTDMNANIKSFWKFVLSGRLNFGFIVPYPGYPLSLDDNDYLRIDCMNEGRGWQNPSQWGTLYSRRGKAKLNMSIEHRFPIERRYVWGLMFLDASGIYDEPRDFSLDPKKLYYSTGLGISFIIPGFPIRLYLARRFKYDYTLHKFQLANDQHFFRSWDFIFSVAGFF